MSARRLWAGDEPERVEQRITIEPDGTIVARSGKVEYGQGIRTAFARIVAEEMQVPIERVRVELGETDRAPWDMGTFGSLSVAFDGRTLRAAVARAKQLLDAGRPIEGPIPAHVTLQPAVAPEDRPLRLEALDIVTGRARYVADVRLPGMLRGHVLQPPCDGARLLSLDDTDAKAMAGVRIVKDESVIGVVAEWDEDAVAAAGTLRVEWAGPEPQAIRPVVLTMRADGPARDDGAGAPTLQATYHVPHIAHASIGTGAAVADVRADGTDVYVSTHRPFGVRDEVADLLGCDPGRVRVHPQMTTGTYGRGNITAAALDAVRLSRAVGRPVLVQWTRAEEFRCSPARPQLDMTLSASLDASGAIDAWREDAHTNSHAYGAGLESPQMIAMTSGRNAVPPYRLRHANVTLHVSPGAIPTGPFRSLAAAPNVFAIESFMDELACAAGADPIEFRLRHVDDARLRRVLERVRDESGWTSRTREVGIGVGVACAIYNGTYVAEITEVSVGGDAGVRVERVWCGVDAGRLVHPDGARNQIEGGIQQAASWTLLEELHHENGRIATAGWGDYPIARFTDAPQAIHVVFTNDAQTASTGIGEVGSVPVAAAIANAVFDASGVRARRLPITVR